MTTLVTTSAAAHTASRFSQALAFHRRVRRGYLEIQRAEPKRVRIVDAARPPAVVTVEVQGIVAEALRGA